VSFFYCQQDAYKLHSDIVMILEDIFAYISKETGSVWM